jgi:predicted RNase H-like HicB family nuclease
MRITTMRNTFTAVYLRAPEGGYIARIEELPEIHAEGATIEQAERYVRDAVQLLLDSNRAITRAACDEARVERRALLVFER